MTYCSEVRQLKTLLDAGRDVEVALRAVAGGRGHGSCQTCTLLGAVAAALTGKRFRVINCVLKDPATGSFGGTHAVPEIDGRIIDVTGVPDADKRLDREGPTANFKLSAQQVIAACLAERKAETMNIEALAATSAACEAAGLKKAATDIRAAVLAGDVAGLAVISAALEAGGFPALSECVNAAVKKVAQACPTCEHPLEEHNEDGCEWPDPARPNEMAFCPCMKTGAKVASLGPGQRITPKTAIPGMEQGATYNIIDVYRETLTGVIKYIVKGPDGQERRVEFSESDVRRV